jgi:hypothetical protein
MTLPVASVPVATLPVIRALLDQAGRARYASGVLGVRAQPQWPGPAAFTHHEVAVRVVPCESALAVREAIAGRDRDQWLVLLTDRSDEDLGAGIRARLVGNRLRTPDPWAAVRAQFAATGIDTSLTSAAGHREIAIGLLAAVPPGGWPPAPAGVLTRDHALAAVAQAHLAFADPVVDVTSVLGWTADPGLVARIADLRELAGDPLADAVLAWAAGRCGALAGPVMHLLRAGEGSDCVPLGLVAGLLAAAAEGTSADAARLGREGLIRIEPRTGAGMPGPAALASWAGESAALIIDLLGDRAGHPRGEALLARADELLVAAKAEGLADGSDLLRAGLTRRLAALADALRTALAGPQPDDPDQPWIRAGDRDRVEQAWGRVAAHHLAVQEDPRVAAFHAAVRLARWLSAPLATQPAGVAATGLAGHVEAFMDGDAWADSAVNDAASGVAAPDLGAGLAAVLAAAGVRRAAHDASFAVALARDTAAEGAGSADVRYLENLLADVVIPLAKVTPVLALVLDGMSVGVATEIVASVLGQAADGWAEALLPGAARRAAAVAVLPTVTEVSRASLLSGALTTGGQDAELRGYAELCRLHGLRIGPVRGPGLFHKASLDSAPPGHAVAGDVASAIADLTGQPLVICVLNAIDDALDRSDPGGTQWSASAVRHLGPLLDRARYAGRIVVLTADHGHVVERRLGRQRSFADISSGRSRPATEPAVDGEVLVAGDRVLMHGGRAVLAVDEKLRYGPLKAGYHGGASPAEAVVPVVVLVQGSVPDDTGLRLAPPQEPGWWIDPVLAPGVTAPAGPGRQPARAVRGATSVPAAREARLRSAPETAMTLFDLPGADQADQAGTDRVDLAGRAEPAQDAATASVPGVAVIPGAALAAVVTGSAQYTAQRKIAGRLSVPDDQVRDLLAALIDAPSGRIGPAQAAAALAVPPAAVRGAILHVQRLLNVEGYPVIRVDADGATVILDVMLLREQFGIGT